jgi:DNA-binding transcriptional ArsR family regulator
MKHTLGSAAKATGLSKSTLSRAIKAGRISATRSDAGAYEIDPAELHRVFPPIAVKPPETQCMAHHATGDAIHMQPFITPPQIERELEILKAEREREREQLQETISDLRLRLDRSETRVSGLLEDGRKKEAATQVNRARGSWLSRVFSGRGSA